MPSTPRRARFLRALVPVALVAAATVAATGASAAPAPPALAGTVVVSGTRTAYADVTLRRAVTLGADPAVTVSNDRFAGLALVRLQAGAEPPGVAVLRLPGVAEWHYVWVGRAGGSKGSDDPTVNHTHTLPAGRYRLFLATSGATTVTWRLPVAGGRVAVTPRAATTWTYADNAATGVRGTAVTPGYAVEQTGATAHRGLVLGFLWYAPSGDSVGQIGGCLYAGPPSPAELGPAPACGAHDEATVPILSVAGRLVGFMEEYVTPGTWTDKEYVRVAGRVVDGGVSSSLLDLGAGFPAAG